MMLGFDPHPKAVPSIAPSLTRVSFPDAMFHVPCHFHSMLKSMPVACFPRTLPVPINPSAPALLAPISVLGFRAPFQNACLLACLLCYAMLTKDNGGTNKECSLALECHFTDPDG